MASKHKNGLPTKVINSHFCSWIISVSHSESLGGCLNTSRNDDGVWSALQTALCILACLWVGSKKGQWADLPGRSYLWAVHSSLLEQLWWPWGRACWGQFTGRTQELPGRTLVQGRESQGHQTDPKTRPRGQGGSDFESHCALSALTFSPHLICLNSPVFPIPFL